MGNPTAVKANGRYVWVVEFEVDAAWVADGFSLDDDRALNMLGTELGWANMSTELGARVLRAPKPEQVATEQGTPAKGFAPYAGDEFEDGYSTPAERRAIIAKGA